MAGSIFTTPSIPFADVKFNGGLNTTKSPLNLQDNESPDLRNIDFDKSGSILKRNGYVCLNTDSSVSIGGDGLFWYEKLNTSSPAHTRLALRVYNGKLQKMDDLDGTWDDITGAATITSSNHCDFENFDTQVFIANGVNKPFITTGAAATTASTPAGTSIVSFVKGFNNYLFYANVTVSGVWYPTRLYWSALRDATTWDSADWVEVGKNDGQPITGIKVLGNALVVFKTDSIYNIYFTGDSEIPFTVQKSVSPVGCRIFSSVQEVQNGLAFFSNDGFYYYDGVTSTKISDKISATIQGYNSTNFTKVRSLIQKNKNRVWWAFTSGGQTNNDRVLVWDYFNNAWSEYVGMSASAMATFVVNGVDERPYFQDYTGRVYRGDFGTNDYPLNTATAIDGYYWTNWRPYSDLTTQKGTPNVYLYYPASDSTLSFSHSFDFEEGKQFTQSFNMSAGGAEWDSAVWDSSTWAGSGGKIKRLDLTGRGRAVRYNFSNSVLGETFRIDGFGQYPHAETNV